MGLFPPRREGLCLAERHAATVPLCRGAAHRIFLVPGGSGEKMLRSRCCSGGSIFRGAVSLHRCRMGGTPRAVCGGRCAASGGGAVACAAVAGHPGAHLVAPLVGLQGALWRAWPRLRLVWPLRCQFCTAHVREVSQRLPKKVPVSARSLREKMLPWKTKVWTKSEE
jgi:hypothetical protein